MPDGYASAADIDADYCRLRLIFETPAAMPPLRHLR